MTTTSGSRRRLKKRSRGNIDISTTIGLHSRIKGACIDNIIKSYTRAHVLSHYNVILLLNGPGFSISTDPFSSSRILQSDSIKEDPKYYLNIVFI